MRALIFAINAFYTSKFLKVIVQKYKFVKLEWYYYIKRLKNLDIN